MTKKIHQPVYDSIAAFRASLQSEGGAIGPFMITSDAAFVETAGHAGYDFVVLDMEHGPGTYLNLQNLIRAANVSGVMPVVRVPRGTDIYIDRALDVGAGAVLIPQIDNAAQAREAIAAAKFNPRGNRGVCRFVRAGGYGSIPGSDYFSHANDTMVILQAEGKKAVDNIDEILDVEGLDVLFIGPYDLSGSLGLIGQIDHPTVVACMKDIIRKANEKNVIVGTFADSAENAAKWRDLGVRFLGYSCDTGIFFNAAKADVDTFHKDR